MSNEFDFSREEELLGSGELEEESGLFELGEQEGEYDHEAQIGDDRETELAAELLTLSGEEELEQFLGGFFKRAIAAGRNILNTAAGQQLKKLLRNTANKALGLGGRAVGSYIGGAKGGDIGADAGSLAGRIFGLELEGMSAEDQELEVAKSYVRLANDAVTRLAGGGGLARGNPLQVAQSALAAAARRHAPGLLRGGIGSLTAGNGPGPASHGGGVWRRFGRKIVLYGV